MKRIKIISLIISLFTLLFFSNVLVHASDFKYIWSKTTINMSIGESLSEYLDDPYAELYYHGVKIEDAEINYLKDGAGTLYPMSLVTSNKVGVYQVMFKAFEAKYLPGTCDNYKQIITINVYDGISPEIISTDTNFKISYKVKTYDFSKAITATDNTSNLTLNIDDSQINYGVVGNYELFVTAKDSSNITSQVFVVEVVDREAPIITNLYGSNTIKIPYSDSIDFRTYFSGSDDYDGVITDKINISNDLKLGTNKVELSLADSSNNTTTLNVVFVISDTEKPVITLSKESIELDLSSNLSSINYKSYIASVSDNYTALEASDCVIDTSEVKKQVGTYQVLYKVSDDQGYVGVATLNVTITTTIKPEIICSNPTVYVGESFNYLDYISINDSSDSDCINNLKVTYNNVDTTKEGTYVVKMSVFNSSGNFSDSSMIVYVKTKAVEESTIASSIDYRYIIIGGLAILLIIVMCYKKKH